MVYYSLIKPGIVYGNALTALAGFLFAAHGVISWPLLTAVLLGQSFVIASAAAFNNYLDRDIDALMERTRNRPLPAGQVTPRAVCIFASVLICFGIAILFLYTNILSLSIALFGFTIYVLAYSPAKRRTMYATHVGAFAGASPPVIGYTAVTHSLDLSALFLFAALCFWQMAHFFAIAIYRKDEYAAAKIPILPLRTSIRRAKLEIFCYVLAFAIAALALSFVGHAGYVYTIIMSIVSVVWLTLALRGFSKVDEKSWARKMFFLSLLVLVAWCIALVL